MSHRIKSTFQLSCLAAAVLSLSACSTAEKIPGLETVGDGLGKVGSKTMEMSSNAWEGTKNFLNIGPTESEFLDEVDLALMEDDANPDGLNVQGIQVASNGNQPLLPAENTLADASGSQELLPESGKESRKLVFGEKPKGSGDIVVLSDGTDPAAVKKPVAQLATAQPASTAGGTVGTRPITHVVKSGQTLWDIAKLTTGDANNWHVIADVNDLAPNAAVFVGQPITIPADMIRADYNDVLAAAENPETPALNNDKAEAAVALQVPKAPTTDSSVAAAATELQPAGSENTGSENLMANATALKVAPGETLWDFAKRTTGDATNWKSIAEENKFSESQLASIRPGQNIYVPNDMVRYRDPDGVLIAKGEEANVPGASIGVKPANQKALEASAAVLAGTNQPAAEGDIKIVEAAYQEDKPIKPVTAESLAEEVADASEAEEPKLGKVMVSGTYYPKAVYNKADFSSSLLMRVSPGTQLLVSKAIGPWLEVQTDKGVGYVHSRDIK